MTIKDIQMPTLKCVKKAEEVFKNGGIYICPMCSGECQFCEDDYQCSECEKIEEELTL